MADPQAKQKASIGLLITHIGKTDNHLYQALTRLSSAVVDVANQNPTGGWYIVPVDSSGNAVPDLSMGVTQSVTATQSVFVENPVNSSQTSFILRFLQDGTGGWGISFDSKYLGTDNLALLTDPNTRSMIHFTVRPDGMVEMNFTSTGLAS